MIDETAHNEHIAKIAALPRVDKVLESSNFGNMPPRCMQGVGDTTRQKNRDKILS